MMDYDGIHCKVLSLLRDEPLLHVPLVHLCPLRLRAGGASRQQHPDHPVSMLHLLVVENMKNRRGMTFQSLSSWCSRNDFKERGKVMVGVLVVQNVAKADRFRM